MSPEWRYLLIPGETYSLENSWCKQRRTRTVLFLERGVKSKIEFLSTCFDNFEKSSLSSVSAHVDTVVS